MRKILAFLLIACSISVVNSCKKDNAPSPKDPNISEYTIMFYGLGSGLDTPLYASLFEEVPSAKVSNKVNFTALVKFRPDFQDEEENKTKIENGQLVYIADSLKGTIYITRPEKALKIQKYAEDDSIPFYEPKTLADFINISAKDYPADKYILVLWDHGSVFDEDDIPLTKSMLRDPKLGKSMSIHQIEAGISQSNIKKVEMIYADLCLTGNIETINQFSSVANYYLGSANIVPGTGGNYADFINGLIDEKDFISFCKSYMDKTINIWKKEDNANKLYQDLFLADLNKINPVVESFKKVSNRYIQLYQDNKSKKLDLDSLQINGYKECILWDGSTDKAVRWENYGRFYYYDNGVGSYNYSLYDNPQVDEECYLSPADYTTTDLYASFETMNEELKDTELTNNLKEFKEKIEAMVQYRVENSVPKLYNNKYRATIGLKWVNKSRANGYMLQSDKQSYDAESNIMYLYPKTRFGEQTNWHRYFDIYDVDKAHMLQYYEVKADEPFLIDENE